MATDSRPTLRCLVDDLRLELPPLEVSLSLLDHPLIRESQRVAPDSPRGQRRILSITDRLVFRIRAGRLRGATWVELETDRLWLLAGEEREEGSRSDAYQHFVGLWRLGHLYPTPTDARRSQYEAVAREIHAVRGSVGDICRAVRSRLGVEAEVRVTATLGSRYPVRVKAKMGRPIEIWVAISHRDSDGNWGSRNFAEVMFAMFEVELATQAFESVADFDGERLEHWEVARLYLAETQL